MLDYPDQWSDRPWLCYGQFKIAKHLYIFKYIELRSDTASLPASQSGAAAVEAMIEDRQSVSGGLASLGFGLVLPGRSSYCYLGNISWLDFTDWLYLWNDLHIWTLPKCALDKLRFELTLYGFFSKQKCDLIVSIVWRSWRSKWRSRWSQRWWAFRRTTTTTTSSRPSSGGHDLQTMETISSFLLFREKSVQCQLKS